MSGRLRRTSPGRARLTGGEVETYCESVMIDFSNVGRILVVIGLIIAGIGLVMIFAGKIPWIGRLPGDFFFRGKNFSFYFPLTTGLLISVILTIILWFLNRR
jgi:hypothetical protein